MTDASEPTLPTPTIAVGAIVVVDQQLLMVTRGHPPAQGLWTVPGGRVEFGETLADAIVREVHEETGLAVTCGPLVGWVERFGSGYHFLIMDFRATPVAPSVEHTDRQPRLQAGDDADDAAWVPLSAVATLPLVPGLFEFLSNHRIIPAED